VVIVDSSVSAPSGPKTNGRSAVKINRNRWKDIDADEDGDADDHFRDASRLSPYAAAATSDDEEEEEGRYDIGTKSKSQPNGRGKERDPTGKEKKDKGKAKAKVNPNEPPLKRRRVDGGAKSVGVVAEEGEIGTFTADEEDMDRSSSGSGSGSDSGSDSGEDEAVNEDDDEDEPLKIIDDDAPPDPVSPDKGSNSLSRPKPLSRLSSEQKRDYWLSKGIGISGVGGGVDEFEDEYVYVDDN
jgi:hypothetical protein